MLVKEKKKKGKRVLIICGSVVVAAAAVCGGLYLYGRHQMGKIPGLSFDECVDYTISGDNNAVITVGVISGGEASWEVYSQNADITKQPYTYEIGSVTKTVTAAMVCRASEDGLIDLDAPLSDYLDLPAKEHYPTVRSLLTHTSGYSSYYYESPMMGNFFSGKNSFCGIGDSMVLDRLGNTTISDSEHSFDYSNFGFAALGLILEKTYQTEFTMLMNEFLAEQGLENTHISDGSGDLGNMWDWVPSDTYLSAGGLVSNIEDMLKYAQLQLDSGNIFEKCHESQCAVNASSDDNKMMDINIDEVGLAWIIDDKNGFIWHNGGTGHYNSYIGFSPENNCAVVVLSNTAPSYRIPATVIGVKKLKELCE